MYCAMVDFQTKKGQETVWDAIDQAGADGREL
jgi:hypothetical protein